MARIDFTWSEPKLNTYDKINPDDLFTALPAEFKKTEKPLLVFLTSDLPEDGQEMQNIESTTMRDESVQIGATMFRNVKLNGTKIREGHPHWKILGGKALPRVVVVDAAGAKVGSVEGQDVSTSKVYAFMKKAASRTYKVDLETIVKETKTVLTEMDRIDAQRKALETKMAKSTADKGTEWAKEAKALDEAQKTVEARDAALKKKWIEDRKVTKA